MHWLRYSNQEGNVAAVVTQVGTNHNDENDAFSGRCLAFLTFTVTGVGFQAAV